MSKPWENYQERQSSDHASQAADSGAGCDPQRPRPWAPRPRDSETSGQPDDPFFDPFSPEPVAPPPQAEAPASTNPPPPADASAPPAPAASDSAHVSPATVFMGGYMFVGIAAVLLAIAVASLVALSDLRSRHGGAPTHVIPMIAAVAAALVVIAGMVLWLGILDDRRRRWARTSTWVVCGLVVCTAAAVFAINPGSSVPWFAHLVHLGAVAVVVASLLSALLLALPQSNAYFQADRPEHVDTPALSQTEPSSAPVSWMPADRPDRDPFA